MQNSTATPNYFLAPGSPVIANYNSTFQRLNDLDKHTLELDIHREMVTAGDATLVLQSIMALQHYPRLIHKLVFLLEFNFVTDQGSKLYTAKRIWKQDPDYLLWFRNLMQMPFIIFFMNDDEMRYCALMGDVVAANPEYMQQLQTKGFASINLTSEEANMLEERLFQACLSMLIFCHGSGFNPEIYVLGVLSFFNVKFTYEDILCEYAEDVIRGTFRLPVRLME